MKPSSKYFPPLSPVFAARYDPRLTNQVPHVKYCRNIIVDSRARMPMSRGPLASGTICAPADADMIAPRTFRDFNEKIAAQPLVRRGKPPF